VEDFYPGGNLKWHINSNLFEEQEAKFYIAELILAIEYLHKKDIIYKNLKSEKIFINKNNHIQLSGFGLIKEKKEEEIQDEDTFFGIQDEYISPEVATLRGTNKMADIYGIGVVLYEMVCGTKPFYSKDNNTLYNNANNNKLMMSDFFSNELKNLLTRLLCNDSQNKTGIKDINEIKKDIFFKDIDWNKLNKKEIVPPMNLVKNKAENKNKYGFKKKNKNEEKDYFLDFDIVKKVKKFTFIRKYVTNKNDTDNNNKLEEKTDGVNINENYI